MPATEEEMSAAVLLSWQPLAGLRVVSSIFIMVFHHTRLRRHLGIAELNAALERHPGVLQTILHGWLGMDILFLLCGMLATQSLVPALRDRDMTVKQAVLRYWWRRAWRIAPAYWVSLVVTYFLVLRQREAAAGIPEAASAMMHYPADQCPGRLWYAAAFLSHWFPRAGCGLQLWSQSCMAHFYFLLPLALAAAGPRRPGYRHRIYITAGLAILVSAAYRLWAVWRHDLTLPLIFMGSDDPSEIRNLDDYQYWLHYPLLARLASLATGVLLALPFLRPGNVRTGEDMLAATGRWGPQPPLDLRPNFSFVPAPVAAIGAGLSLVALSSMVRQPLFDVTGARPWDRQAGWLHLVAWVQGGVVSSALLAFVMGLIMAQAGTIGKIGHAAFGADIWEPLGEWSYSAYLYHEQVRFWLWYTGVLPSGVTKSASDMTGLAIELAVSLVVTYVVAAVSYRLIERPAILLGRRLEPSALRPGGGVGRGKKAQ